jgi:crossover junction endodeoxyribonuclease RusA
MGDCVTEYLVRLPWPSSALASNARGHWAIKAKAAKDARKTAWALSLEQGVNRPMPDAEIVLSYYPPNNRRRDAQNMPHSLKAYIDGISDAMGCDDHKFRVKYPSEFDKVTKGGAILAHIKPRTVLLPALGSIS